MFERLFLHVSVSVCTYLPLFLVPGEIYDVMQGDRNFIIFYYMSPELSSQSKT